MGQEQKPALFSQNIFDVNFLKWVCPTNIVFKIGLVFFNMILIKRGGFMDITGHQDDVPLLYI